MINFLIFHIFVVLKLSIFREHCKKAWFRRKWSLKCFIQWNAFFSFTLDLLLLFICFELLWNVSINCVLSTNVRNVSSQPDCVGKCLNPITWKTEAGEPLSLRLAWSTG